MKKLLQLLLLPLLVMCSKSGNDVAGTATDVNTGTIAGVVKNDGATFKDTVLVSLYAGDSILAKRLAVSANPEEEQQTTDGSFEFDSLAEGTYSIRITKDSITIGDKFSIDVPKGKTVNITINVTIIINQTFNITNVDNSSNVTVNNYYFNGTNGIIERTDNGSFLLTFTDQDTVTVTAKITTDGESDTIDIVFIKQDDDTYNALPIDTDLPIYIEEGTTSQNTGTGGDSSSVVIDGKISEETR